MGTIYYSKRFITANSFVEFDRLFFNPVVSKPNFAFRVIQRCHSWFNMDQPTTVW